MENSGTDLLTRAVAIWTGWRKSAIPHRNDSLLFAHFGDEVAAELIQRLKALEADFYSSDAALTAANVAEMSRTSIEHFKRRHPKVPDEIAQAFAWCYTYDYK